MPEQVDPDDSLRGQRIDLVLGTSLGGVGRHVHALAAALGAAGSRYVVHGPAATERTFAFAATGADFEALSVPAGLAPWRANRAAAVLRRSLLDPSVVHAHGLRAGLVTAHALRSSRTTPRPPLVVTWHNLPAAKGARERVNAALERRLVRAAEVTVAVSPDIAARVEALGGRDVRLLPVGADKLPRPTRRHEEIRAELSAAGRPVLLTVGRLHPQKGLDVLLAAAATWQDRPEPPVVVVAGDGPQRRELMEMADHYAVDVRWLGYVADRHRLAELLSVADVVVVPSRWEGSPLAVHEALLASRPVVASAVGGLPSLLHDDEVRFVPPQNAPALAAAVEDLLDHPDGAAQLGKRGHLASGRWPTSGVAAKRVLELYAELLRRT
ncbi:MAG: glycosyltransferase family 4 protein [Actinomycetes bacterium]